MVRHGVLALLLLSFTLFSGFPLATAQAPSAQTAVFDFGLTVDPGVHVATLQDGAFASVTVTDNSRDSPQGLVAGQNGGVLGHIVSFKITDGLNQGDPGWQAGSLGSAVLYPGQSQTLKFKVQVFPTAKHPYYVAHINATFSVEGNQQFYRTGDILFFTKGIPGFTVLPGPSIDGLQPNQIVGSSVQVYNVAIVKRGFAFDVSDNTCNLGVVAPATTVVLPHVFDSIRFSIRGPDSRFNPLSDDNCVVGVKVYAVDNPDQALFVTIPVKVTGTYLDPMAIFDFLVAVLLLVLLVLFLRRRKERLEEEILGKPQKPWTIPVEQVYLRHLRAKDQRAWYVVRHYLMEDEYRSSLLWYTAYKRATRTDRKKERLVLAQEREYAKWKAAWEKDLARPVRKADRFEARLQRKLDGKARKAHRKARRKWRKAVRKLEARHQKKVDKATALHGKLLARARKKGLPEPEEPDLPALDLPAEPALRARPLAEHRWARKATRLRRRMLRRQGNLEVKFERADARKQASLKRKVQRLARDLGDAEFVAHHVTRE